MTGLRRRRLAVVLGAALAAALVWAIADPLLGERLRITDEAADRTLAIGPVPVVAVALLSGLAGWGLLAVLERFARRAAHGVWLAAALAVLALSFLPLTGSGMSGGTRASLAAMHLAVAAVLVPGLGRHPGAVGTRSAGLAGRT
ncbi:DUF6069 family protein [Streptomyces sp. 6N223]|uniref:DUF6069 family protein n=1 Tax=Streptomyces sp. 6N223 TaxID=3457412 RepID=UPI003FD6B0FF